MIDVLIRPERTEDQEEIFDVTQRAFAPMPYADGDEQELIGRFRDAGVLALSLVAERDGAVVGQITFTPAFAADGMTGWYALGPVAVAPELKHQGIGSQLIQAGIAWLQEQDAAGCILIGNPAYYGRFGFLPFPELAPAGMPAEFYQILPLRISDPAAIVAFHPLFSS
jgi:putative acetyltransferase